LCNKDELILKDDDLQEEVGVGEQVELREM
jgi:hypothetical protein